MLSYYIDLNKLDERFWSLLMEAGLVTDKRLNVYRAEHEELPLRAQSNDLRQDQ